MGRGCLRIGPKLEAVIGGWRKLRNQNYNDICCASNVVRVIKSRNKLLGSVASTGEEEIRIQVLAGARERKGPHATPRRL